MLKKNKFIISMRFSTAKIHILIISAITPPIFNAD